MENKLKFGIYEHYKGGRYKVIGIAKHTETLEEMVIYHKDGKDGQDRGMWWVRPLAMFLEKEVEVNENKIPRFRHIE